MTTLQKLIDTIVTKLKPRYNDSYIASLVKPMHKLSTVKDFIADMECQDYNVFIDHNADNDLRATIRIKGTPRHYELVFVDDMGDPAVSLTRMDSLGYYVEEL